eukprot:NODE_511_length_7387_cov_0.329857.p3 type:complete len:216 gc:universal NODE_511_length_7387_cov_0.329857:2891-2244(-)
MNDAFEKDFESHFSCGTDILMEKPLLVQMFVERKYGESLWNPIHFLGFLPENEQYMMFAANLRDPVVTSMKNGHIGKFQVSLPFTSNWTIGGKVYAISDSKTYTRFFPPSIFGDESKFFWNKKRLDMWTNATPDFRGALARKEYLESDIDIMEPFYKHLNDSAIELPEDDHAFHVQNFCLIIMKVGHATCYSQEDMTQTMYSYSHDNWEIESNLL